MGRIYNCTNHSIEIPDMVKGDGVWLVDAQGKQYMDLESGVWCTSLGHCNARINAVLKQQAESILHVGFCYSNHTLEEAADSVLSLTGFEDGHCVFLCSGSEAIELSRQMARHVTQKSLSMTLHDSYLGSYSSVINKDTGWYIFNWEGCQRCPDQDDCDAGCEKLSEIPEDISEFLFEPGSSSGFVRFPPKSVIQAIVNRIRSQGGTIIANEVTTGIGRTGKWFGYTHYQIEPDMVVMGKGLGNGYPVSATAINKRTAEALCRSSFRYMQSHQNDPLGAAVAKEVLAIIEEEELIQQAATKGSRFFDMLNVLKDDRIITGVRGRGLMLAIDLCDPSTAGTLFHELLQQGYIVGNRGALFRIDPPLTVREEELVRFVQDFRKILTFYRP
ncbi:MAG: aspartate aminotransferase family protein [Desulfohalobiaceae bacterium]|nr:aspartate aminotransferase family protein [Desulfohalobiaceae bacterium]